jgi:4-hydroxythreonine-4-phosphate dehydrogenase
MTDLVIIADDLTGAGDSATLFAERAATGITLDAAAPWPELPVLAVDTDSRYTTPTEAARRVAAAAERALGLGARVYKKIDSLLRGNVAAEVAAAARALGSGERPALAVVAPAFPSTGRTTVEGVVLVHGEPLSAPQHGRVAAVLAEADLTTATAPLDRQGSPAALAELLASAWGDSVDGVVVDAVSDADLARVAQATADLEFPVLLVGSGGLARPLRALIPMSQAPSVAAADIQGPVLVVVGSYAEQARAQREELVRAGFGEVFLDPADLPAMAAAMREGLGAGDVVLAPDPRLPVRREDAATIASTLAQAALAVLDDLGMLVATGGETARSILTAAGVTQLEVLGEVEPGVVQAKLPGRDLILLTKAGAFGDPGTLLRCVQALRAASPAPNQEAPMRRPIVAITMGDAAGVGPEIIVKALADPDVYTWARPLVVGDARRLRRALEITGVDLEVRTVPGPREAAFRPGVVDCLDLDCIPPDLPFGKLSPEAGEGAYRFVERATQLAVAGEVDAICTAPLNKEALHAAGHKYPGHTELLAELTGTDEVSMMLSAPKLRVIHVTTHIGLLDMVERINPGLVERAIRRGHDTLVKAGIQQPRIAVCGINPHAGEHGLFGRGEEETKVAPGIEAARANGIDAQGPLPADTVFFRAGRGDFDLVVAMYHDQGHGPVKVMGLESGVNITVGLPVIRTSVDHGTAFDIAGTGKADQASMLEALRQAADLAPDRAEKTDAPT